MNARTHAHVAFNQRAMRDLLRVELEAIRSREQHVPGGTVKVFESVDHVHWVARVNGDPLPTKFPSAYDAAQAGLARLEAPGA